MGSGSSAARKSLGQHSTGGAPRSRRPSPGTSSSSGSSDPCDPCCPSRGDVWQQGDPSPAATLPFADSVRSEDEDDTDGELDKALAESQDVYEPQLEQEPASGSPPPRAGTPPTGASPLRIPSLELEGTRASSNAQGWALQDRVLRETPKAGWAQENGNTHCCDDSTELFRGCTQDVENNNLPRKFQTKSDVISDSQGPILYDMSEEELMASIEREY